MIWANLLHLSMNMWGDRKRPPNTPDDWLCYRREALEFDAQVWDDTLTAMADAGMNMVVIDLGDAVKYESHPEIAIKGAWSRAKLQRELAKLRKMGLESIPKLNFSACHHTWLGPYSHMTSTPTYYAACRDLIAEVIELFGRPRFLHLGMDEETFGHQRNHEYAVVRQHDLWWHDLHFLLAQVTRGRVRPWIWSDAIWRHQERFLSEMPTSVLQSNWYYDHYFGAKSRLVNAFLDLGAHGYDQIPTGSTYFDTENFERLAAFCARRLAPGRLLGFMQTTWRPATEEFRAVHLEAIEKVAKARTAVGRRGR